MLDFWFDAFVYCVRLMIPLPVFPWIEESLITSGAIALFVGRVVCMRSLSLDLLCGDSFGSLLV